MPTTVVTAAVTVTASSTPTLVVVTTTIDASDLSAFSVGPTFLGPGATPIGSLSYNSAPSSSVTGASTSSSSSSSNGSNSTLIGALAGGIIGGIAFLTILIVMGCLLWRRAKRRRSVNPFQDESFAVVGGRGGAGEKATILHHSTSHTGNDEGLFPSRPSLYGRATPLNGRQSPALMPLMASAHGASLSQSSAPSEGRASFAPSTKFNGSTSRYSMLSVTPSSSAYDYCDPRHFEAASVSGMGGITTPHDVYDQMGPRQPQLGGQTVAGAAPLVAHQLQGNIRLTSAPSQPTIASGSDLEPSVSRSGELAVGPTVLGAGRKDDRSVAEPDLQPEGSAGTLRTSSGPIQHHDRPTSASSSGKLRLLGSTGHDKPAYMTSAAAYASPMTPSNPVEPRFQPSPTDRPTQTQDRTNKASTPARAPVAGYPLRSSTLSTIPGSISEKTPTEHSDDTGGISAASSRTVHNNDGASSVPRLPSIPASSPLVFQSPVMARTSASKAHPPLTEHQRRSSASNRSPDLARGTPLLPTSTSFSPSKGTDSGTIDSTGTFNTYTGQRMGDLHVVGTYSTQTSRMSSIRDNGSEAGDYAAVTTAIGPERSNPPSGPQEQESWTLDSQDFEYWINQDKAGESRPVPQQTHREPLDAIPEAPRRGTEQVPLSGTIRPPLTAAAHQERPSHESGPSRSSATSAHGSRLIEMFEGSDSADHGLVPADPFASQSPLQAAEAEPSTAAVSAGPSDTAKASSVPAKSSSPSSFASILGMAGKDTKASSTGQPGGTSGSDGASSGAGGSSGGVDRPGSTQKSKRVSNSPLNPTSWRFGRFGKSSDEPSVLTAESGTSATTNSSALSLAELPPLHSVSVSGTQGVVRPSGSLSPSPGHGMSRSNSRDSAAVLGHDFFSAATFSQPLLVTTDAPADLVSEVNSGHNAPMQAPAPLVSSRPMDMTRSSSSGLESTSAASRGPNKVKGKKVAAKANQVDIDQLF